MDPFLPFEIKYATTKRFIKPGLWELIERKFFAGRGSHYEQKEYLDYFEYLFGIPQEALDLSPVLAKPSLRGPVAPMDHVIVNVSTAQLPPVVDKRAQLVNFLGQLKKMIRAVYDDPRDESDKLASAFWTHLTSPVNPPPPSTLLDDEDDDPIHSFPPPSQRRPLFILGPGGFGKTTIVEKLAAKFKVPLIFVNLAQASKAEDIFGTDKEPGILLKAIASSKYKNAILFFDEASEAFNTASLVAIFKTLFEADRGRFESPYLNKTQIDMSRYMIVATGNKEITDAYLKERFVNLEFPAFSRSYLDRYANEIMVPGQLEKGAFIKSLRDLNAEESRQLTELISSCKTPRELGNKLPAFFLRLEMKRATHLE